MAGDLDLQECALVLAQSQVAQAAAVLAHVQGAAPGRFVHRYGPRVMLCEVLPESRERLRQELPEVALQTHPEDLAAEVLVDLDPVGALGLAAFALRQSRDYAEAKARRPWNGSPWDQEGTDLPDDHRQLTSGPAPAPAGVGPTSERLVSSVAVGVIIVSGPNEDLQFSSAETAKIIAEVQNGLSWLGSRSFGGNVVWSHSIVEVHIDTPPQPKAFDLEAVWRDPTMAALGYEGFKGVYQYVDAIRKTLNTRWTYCAYFVKYPVSHFAYAFRGGPRLVMQAPYDRWGPDNIDRIFAHETGHVFEGPDEYKESHCVCGGAFGVFNEPNANCANCAPGGGVPCIMKENDWQMCTWTTWHLGFFWPVGLFASDGETSAAPAAAAFNNHFYVFWQANNRANKIFFSSSANGTAWTAGSPINKSDSTPDALAAAVFNNRVYLFWKADDDSSQIYFSASPDGKAWPAGRRINNIDHTPNALAAAVFNNQVYLFWRAFDGSDRIYFSSSADGAAWPAGRQINNVDTTPAALAAAVFYDRLYLFWQQKNSPNRIYFSASADGTTWPVGRQINNIDTTPDALAAAVFNQQLYLFWRAKDRSLIYLSASGDGASWPPGRPINNSDSTPTPQAPAVFKNTLYLFWKSAIRNNRIYHSAFLPLSR